MPSLKKKPDAAASLVPAWHPNFRNYDRLPDTKVVRTAFFINGGAILVALSLLIYFGLSEFQLHGLRAQTADWQQQIDRDRTASNQAIAKFRKFQTDEAKIHEVTDFLNARPLVSDLVVNLGKTLPANVALDTLDLRESTLTLRATVRGAPDKASGYASAYVDALRKAPEFASVFQDVELTSLNRVPTTGRLAIEVAIKLNIPAAKGAKK